MSKNVKPGMKERRSERRRSKVVTVKMVNCRVIGGKSAQNTPSSSLFVLRLISRTG